MKNYSLQMAAVGESVFSEHELPDRLPNPKWSALNTCTYEQH